MKKTITTFLVGILFAPGAFAGFLSMDCEAYRISQDANENVQVFKSSNTGASINNSVEYEIIDGSFQGLYLAPGETTHAVLDATDGRGNIDVTITVLSEVTSVYGRLNVGRDHQVEVYKVSVMASRGDKFHNFIGTCKSELVTTCGGACADEDPNRDVL